jgi:acetyltransferase-like isoleucine patch superfamily enzyme
MPIASTAIQGARLQIFPPDLINLYGFQIGDETKVGIFVEIQKGVPIEARCKVSSHSLICEGVTLEDEVLNDRVPRATNDGVLQTEADWTVVPTLVGKGASIRSGAAILCRVTIEEEAMIGAGAVVTQNVNAVAVVAGMTTHQLR